MSQVNHNAAYLYDVDGMTVWEKLRVIRNFLTDRNQALALAKLELEKKDAEMAKLDKDSFEYREMMIYRPQSLDLIEDCENEIKFLTDFEERLKEEAEKFRIPGKSDKEMYELNFFEEHKRRVVMEAQSEMLAMGHITPQTMRSLMRNREAMVDVVKLGLLTPNVLNVPSMITSSKPETLRLMGAPVSDVRAEDFVVTEQPQIGSDGGQTSIAGSTGADSE